MAVIALIMQARLGKVLCAGPSNVSVDNLADRIYAVSSDVATKYNAAKSDGTDRIRGKLVIRGFKAFDDLVAFINLVKKPDDIDNAAPRRAWGVPSKWHFDLSVAHWMLAIFRSPLVALDEDDSQILHDMRASIDKREDLRPLRDLVAARITWQEFEKSKDTQQSLFKTLQRDLGSAADLVCVTPALSRNDEEWLTWRNTCRGVVVDEAVAMHRSDLFEVWGNVLTPLVCDGDAKQLPPTIASPP